MFLLQAMNVKYIYAMTSCLLKLVYALRGIRGGGEELWRACIWQWSGPLMWCWRSKPVSRPQSYARQASLYCLFSLLHTSSFFWPYPLYYCSVPLILRVISKRNSTTKCRRWLNKPTNGLYYKFSIIKCKYGQFAFYITSLKFQFQ